MSLADHIRYLRAMQGGTETDEIAQALGLETPKEINLAEKKYAPVRDPALVQQLADYYERPLAEFEWHNARPRKFLTFYVAEALRTKDPISLTLRSGEQLTGTATWWDLSSIGLQTEDGRLLVVQRHAVVDWPNATDWEDV